MLPTICPASLMSLPVPFGPPRGAGSAWVPAASVNRNGAARCPFQDQPTTSPRPLIPHGTVYKSPGSGGMTSTLYSTTLIVKSPSLASHAEAPAESQTQTRTSAVVVFTGGRVHAYVFLPRAKEPENMGKGNVMPPSVDRSAATVRTPSSVSPIVHSTPRELP